MKDDELITLAHGNGGLQTHRLIRELIAPLLSPHSETPPFADAATLPKMTGDHLFSTDSFVVDPIFFPGGDIGKLAVTGTINDILVSGGIPLYMSLSLVIEEGFPISELRRIIQSIADTAKESKVLIVTGDTKVVPHGVCDGMFINTSCVGLRGEKGPSGIGSLREGDLVLVSGSVGDHGMALYNAREKLNLRSQLVSDCASVAPLMEVLSRYFPFVRIVRDPTRGGVATTLNEFVYEASPGIQVMEASVPVKDAVRGMCELLGFDPLHVACEGRVVAIVDSSVAEELLKEWKALDMGKEAAVIGRVTSQYPGRVTLRTPVGGERILEMLSGQMLPRIC